MDPPENNVTNPPKYNSPKDGGSEETQEFIEKVRGKEVDEKDPYAPPDGGWGWIVCGSCFFGNIFVFKVMVLFESIYSMHL